MTDVSFLCAHVTSTYQMSGYVGDGTHVRTYAIRTDVNNIGLALSRDGSRFAVSNDAHMIIVYSVEDGTEVCAFGGYGSAPGQFKHPMKLCTSPRDTLLVAEYGNGRVQEVSMTGEHIRFVGEGVICSSLYGIACNGELIAVTKFNYEGSAPNSILLFNYDSGELVTQFAEHGDRRGRSIPITGVRFTPDGQHIIIVDTYKSNRLCMFTLGGVFVKLIGVGVLGTESYGDVDFTADGCTVVADTTAQRVCVFSGDGELLRSWGTKGILDGQFRNPTAFAVHENKLLVLDIYSPRVQVFH